MSIRAFFLSSELKSSIDIRSSPSNPINDGIIDDTSRLSAMRYMSSFVTFGLWPKNEKSNS